MLLIYCVLIEIVYLELNGFLFLQLRRKRLARLGGAGTPDVHEQESNSNDQVNDSQTENKTEPKNDVLTSSDEAISIPSKENSNEKIENKNEGKSTNCSVEKNEWPLSSIQNIEEKSFLSSTNTLSQQSTCQEAMDVDCEVKLTNDRGSIDIDSGIENMEVDEVERRESLKRQRDSACSNEGNLFNHVNPIVMVTPAPEDTIYPILTRIFNVDWRNNSESNRLFKLDLEVEFSCEQNNYSNLIQSVLMKIIEQLIESNDYDSAYKIYNQFQHSKNEGSSSQDLQVSKVIYESRNQLTLALLYVIECYHRVETEEKTSPARCTETPFKDIFSDIRNQCIDFAILILINAFTPLNYDKYNSILTNLVLTQSLPCGFLSGLTARCYHTSNGILGNFKKVFSPLLSSLWNEMQKFCSFIHETHYKSPLEALNELCQISVGKSNKPIGQLVS